MTPPPGTLVLLRHAQSTWNLENRFSGWADVSLSALGVEEARRAGRQLQRQGFAFDIAFVSRLVRARHTLDIVLAELGQSGLPTEASWRLNERHYGALQGLNKAETAARYGEAQFQRWRRGYRDTPPALATDDLRHPRHDPLYADVDPALLPATESLADTGRRVVPYWQRQIAPHLAAGWTVLVVAHGNTLRALVKHLDGLTQSEVECLEIATARPLVYEPAGRASWSTSLPITITAV
jgi:2,3-bisphosphoglycerate-dependent phosphoglycerate mutase